MEMARCQLNWESSTIISSSSSSSSLSSNHNSQSKNKQQMLCLLLLPKGGGRKPPPCSLILTKSSTTTTAITSATFTTVTAASSSRAQLESKRKQQQQQRKSKPSSGNDNKGRGGGPKKGPSNDDQFVPKKSNNRDMPKSGKPTRHYSSSSSNSNSKSNSNSSSNSNSNSHSSSHRADGSRRGGDPEYRTPPPPAPFEPQDVVGFGGGNRAGKRPPLKPTPLPSPPAGFIVDAKGRLSLMAPPERRIAIIVDPSNGSPLECMIRRVFESDDGRQSFLMCPLDMPLQILKVEDEGDGVSDLDDQEMEEILPTVAYELAKRRLHLVLSGFCLTARGGFRYTEEDIIDLNTEYGQEGADGSLNEGVEIAKFNFKGVEHVIYSPLDPLLFVACKNDETGELVLAEDDVLDDKAVLDAIDEEKEFDLLVEEEIAINASLEAYM